MATIKKPVVQKAQKGILKRLSCPSNVKDCGPTWGERRAIRKEENKDERQTRKAEKITLKEEKKTDKLKSNFQKSLGNPEPPKLAIDYKEKERKAGGRFGLNSAKKGTKLSKSMKTGGKMIKKSPKKK